MGGTKEPLAPPVQPPAMSAYAMRAPYMAIIIRTACTMPHVRSCCNTIREWKCDGWSAALGLMHRTNPASVCVSSSRRPESDATKEEATVLNERPVPPALAAASVCTALAGMRLRTAATVDAAHARARSA